MDASVRTRVVSWNDAAEMNESVESEAFVMPSSSGRPCAGRPPARRDHALVLLDDAELVHLLVDEEFGVGDVLADNSLTSVLNWVRSPGRRQAIVAKAVIIIAILSRVWRTRHGVARARRLS